MDIKVVLLIECDFVGVENVKTTTNRPQLTSEDVTFGVVLIDQSGSSDSEETEAELL